MIKVINKIIEPGETIVRCLIESYLKSKNQRIASKALEPRAKENDISMLRLDYTDKRYCVEYGQRLNGASGFRGLLYLTPQIVEGVNQWARSGISAGDISGNRKNNGISSWFVYSPLDKNENPLPTDIDLTNDTSNGDCHMHCDLRFSEKRIEGVEEVLNTRIRKYAEQLKDRVKYQIAVNPETGELGEIEHEEIFQKYNETPVLSIIIPFYNAKKYLDRVANSILPQTKGKPVEVIFINDGDNDSFSVLKPFLDQYPRETMCFGQSNQGVAVARNHGMELARGEYLWFVDADDKIADGAVDAVLEQITTVHMDVFMFRMADFDQKGKPVDCTRVFHEGDNIIDTNGLQVILSHLSYSPVQMCVFNRQFMQNNNLEFVELAPHDLEIMPRLLLKANEVRLVPRVIYHYYHNYDGKHKTKYTYWRTENHLKMLDQYDQMIAESNDEQVKKALYITQFRQLRHILHDSNKKEFKSQYKEWNIDARKPQIRNILRNSFYMVKTPKDLGVWLLWYISPCWYKKLQPRHRYSKK